MAASLHILSGGAAAGLVRKLQAGFEARHGCRIEGSFGAVGGMREKLLAGSPCDLLILTQALIDDLAAQGRADAASVKPVGLVKTGVALKDKHAAVTADAQQAELAARLVEALSAPQAADLRRECGFE